VGYSDCDGSVTFRRPAQPDDWMLLPPGKDLSARHFRRQTTEIPGRTLTVIPPGDSEITLAESGQAVRAFSRNAADLSGPRDETRLSPHSHADFE